MEAREQGEHTRGDVKVEERGRWLGAFADRYVDRIGNVDEAGVASGSTDRSRGLLCKCHGEGECRPLKGGRAIGQECPGLRRVSSPGDPDRAWNIQGLIRARMSLPAFLVVRNLGCFAFRISSDEACGLATKERVKRRPPARPGVMANGRRSFRLSKCGAGSCGSGWAVFPRSPPPGGEGGPQYHARR